MKVTRELPPLPPKLLIITLETKEEQDIMLNLLGGFAWTSFDRKTKDDYPDGARTLFYMYQSYLKEHNVS